MTWTDRLRQHRHDQSPAGALLALGDLAVSSGDSHAGEDLDDLGDTLLHVQRTLGNPSTTLEPATRQRIWEEIMLAQVEDPSAHTAGIGRHIRQRDTTTRRSAALAATAAQWQPAISFLVVMAFLVSLIGLAYNRGVLDDLGTSQQPASELDPLSPDRMSPTGPTVSDVTCAPRTEGRLSENDLRVFSIDDWYSPIHDNAKPASPEIAQMALDTYLAYSMCESERFFATPSAATDASDARQTYLSDRMRYLLLYDTLTPAHQQDVDDFLADNPSDDIVAGFPLPVNRDIDRYVTIGDDVFVFSHVFMVGEVYVLPDGRYAAIMGSISTQMLIEQRPRRQGDGAMTFVAFWPEDGRLYIDEMLSLCVPGLAPPPMPDATPESVEEALGLPVYAACT